MMPLKFIVKGQQIKKDPSSPFNRLVAGTSNYYYADFYLDQAWNGYACVACFKAHNLTKYVPIVNGSAAIPDDIMKCKEFHVSIVGKKGATKLVTNDTAVYQSGGMTNG